VVDPAVAWADLAGSTHCIDPAFPVVVPVQSVEALGARLRDARRVVLVGNGGIALGLAHEVCRLLAVAVTPSAPFHAYVALTLVWYRRLRRNLTRAVVLPFRMHFPLPRPPSQVRGCDVVWAVREAYVGSTFFDASASAFFLAHAAGRMRVVDAGGDAHADAAAFLHASSVAASGGAPAPTADFLASGAARDTDSSVARPSAAAAVAVTSLLGTVQQQPGAAAHSHTSNWIESGSGCACCAGEAAAEGAVAQERAARLFEAGNAATSMAAPDSSAGGTGAACALPYNWHSDQPLPARVQRVLNSSGPSTASSTPAGQPLAADDEREFVPSYAPLPTRARRRAHKASAADMALGAAGSSGAVDCAGGLDAAVVAAAVGVTTVDTAACATAPDAATPASPGAKGEPTALCHSSDAGACARQGALGPGWAAHLRTVPHAAAAASGSLGSAAGSAAAAATTAASGGSSGLVFIELQVYVAAITSWARGLRWHMDAAGRVLRTETVAPPDAAAPSSSGTGPPPAADISPTPPDARPWPLTVTLSNGHEYACDTAVFATGVRPSGKELLPADAVALWCGSASSRVHGTGSSGVADSALASDAHLHRVLQQPPVAGSGRPFYVAPDGGLLVNNFMQTTGSQHIYAAGDAATVVWPQLVRRLGTGGRGSTGECAAESRGAALARGTTSELQPPLWFQMRLWNQARQQAIYAARAMAGQIDSLEADDGRVAFELFGHVTRFLGFKVALLGLYNGQGLRGAHQQAIRRLLVAERERPPSRASSSSVRVDRSGGGGGADDRPACAGEGEANKPAPPTLLLAGSACVLPPARPPSGGSDTAEPREAQLSGQLSVQVRVTPGVEYAKVVLLGGRVVGALLVGETDLEETMENLCLNRLPVTTTRRRLLAPDASAAGGAAMASGCTAQSTTGSTTAAAGRVDDSPASLAYGEAEVLDLLDPDVDIEDFFD